MRTFKKFGIVTRMHPRYSGFILLIKYPGCRREVGDFEPYTNGEFLNFPLIWKPVLHTDIMRDEKIEEILK